MSDVCASLYGELFGDADVASQLSPQAALQAMLDVENALAQTQGALGIIPAEAAASIAAVSRAERYDIASLAREAAVEGNVAIPLVRAMRRVLAEENRGAADWVHFGVTSQDIVDTALVLQLRAAITIVVHRLDSMGQQACALARAHARTLMPGRTWLRQAAPTTFGLVAAGWMDALRRASHGLRRRLDDASVVQLGGATGTLAPFKLQGREVANRLASRLGLVAPPLPWHSHRDRLVRLAGDLAVACGTLGKIARDVALLGQDEVSEVLLTSGGGSSTMPHKHNPVACAVMLAASTRAPGLVATMLAAMPQESERGLGGWHAEWETMVALTAVTAGAARAGADAMGSIEVHPERMLQNLETTRGTIMAEAVMFALAARIGRQRAQAVVTRASVRSRDERRNLADTLLDDPEVAQCGVQRRDLDAWMDPAPYADAAEALVNAALQAAGVSRAHS